MHSPRRPLVLATAGLLCAALFLPAALTPRALQAAPAAKPVADHERDEAILKGLRYLEAEVFGLPDVSGTPRKPFTVAATGLAFLWAGDRKTSRTGGRKMIDRARRFLAAYVDEVAERSVDRSQLPQQNGQVSSDKLVQYTWPLAMNALFQTELHARGVKRASATGALKRIVPLLEACQAPNGGWGHGTVLSAGSPRGDSVMDGLGTYPDTLLASSNLVAAALASSHAVVAPAKADVFDKARAYFRYAELSNGNFPYDPSQRSAGRDLTGVSRAAGAVFALHLLGIDWKDRGMRRALRYIDDNFAYLSEGHGSSTFNLLLAAFLQRARSEKDWKRFRTTFFRRILDKQGADGGCACICEGKAFASTNDSKPFGGKMAGNARLFGDSTKAYVTALHTLILLLDRTALKRLTGEPAPPPSGPVTPSAR